MRFTKKINMETSCLKNEKLEKTKRLKANYFRISNRLKVSLND